MSGYKYSKVIIEQEQRARQRELNLLGMLTNSIDTVKRKLRKLLMDIPEGARVKFPEEMKDVRRWIDNKIPVYTPNMTSSELKEIRINLERVEQEGVKLLELLVDIKNVRLPEAKKRLIKKYEQIISELNSIENLAVKWNPIKFNKLKEKVRNLHFFIDKGDLQKSEKFIESINSEFVRFKEIIISFEEKDKNRWYVLNALRETCKEMGWEEKGEPKLENSKNPKSRIVYVVDTLSSGLIKFYLSLDGIFADSEIPLEGDLCYKEFDTISKLLKSYGVNTKFERVTADEEPKLLQRGELDLPDEGMGMEMEV